MVLVGHDFEVHATPKKELPGNLFMSPGNSKKG
jgi:hypothetical protein